MAARRKYDGPKKNTMLCLTATARQILDEKAGELGLSRSDYIEQLARGILPGHSAEVIKAA